MRLVGPDRCRSMLHDARHLWRGLIADFGQRIEEIAVAGDEARAKAGQVGPLGQRVEDEQVLETLGRGSGNLEAAGRRRVGVDLRIALVEEQDEVVTARQCERAADVVGRGDGTLRVGGRAQVEPGRAPQNVGLLLQLIEIGQVAGIRRGVEEIRFAAGAVCSTNIGLVIRVGDQHHRLAIETLAADCRQRREVQALARAVDGQNLARRIDGAGKAVAPADPSSDGLAQFVGAADLRIARQLGSCLGQLLGDERRHRLARIADGELDRPRMARRDVLEQASRPGEGRNDPALGEGLKAGGSEHGQSLVPRACGARGRIVAQIIYDPCARLLPGWRRSCARSGRHRGALPRH